MKNIYYENNVEKVVYDCFIYNSLYFLKEALENETINIMKQLLPKNLNQSLVKISIIPE